MKIFTGPVGTELQKRGYKTTLPLWSGTANLDAPELVYEIQKDYIKAGADIIITNTFRTNVRPWIKVNREKEAATSTKAAIEISLKLKKEFPEVLVGGSITSLEDCYEPQSVPPLNELEAEHGSQVELFKDSGIDFLMIETVNSIIEAKVIAGFAFKAKLPIWLSVVTDDKGDLLSGESLAELKKEIDPFKPEVYGLNCRPPEVIIKAAKKLAKIYKGDKLIYGNGDGQPANDLGWEFYERCSPAEYLKHAEEWNELGFNIIGSCCGSGPEYIKALTEKFKN